MDFFSKRSDMKEADDLTSKQKMDFFTKKIAMKESDGLTSEQAMDFSSQETDTKVQDEHTPFQAMDFFSHKPDMKVEDSFNSDQAMDISSQDIDMKVQDEPTPYQAIDFSSQKTDIKIEIELTPNQTNGVFSQNNDMKFEDEPVPSTSPCNFKRFQRIHKRKQRREELNFKPYILRLKKVLIPGLQLSSSTLEDLNNLISNVYGMYCTELQRLFSHTKKKTLSAKDVESATKLCMQGKLKDNTMMFVQKVFNFEQQQKRNPRSSQEA